MLNTQFLNLILKSLRQSPGTLSTNSAAGSSSRQQAMSASNSTAHASLLSALNNCRILAATSLALLIRYATTISPPSIKNRDDHILPTLVSLLREGTTSTNIATNQTTTAAASSQRIDPRLKRRGIAALGELVFYISSQLDANAIDGVEGGPNDGGDGGDKWVLPLGAVNVVMKCLKDDSDEIVRHYAAKVRQFPFF